MYRHCVPFYLSLLADDLRNHFEQFGELVDVAVMKDQYGVPRCFGFVQFADENLHTCKPTDEHVIVDKKVDTKPIFSGLRMRYTST